MFVGRERDIALAVSLLQNGKNVDIIGGRGSGRSSFLHALHNRLKDLDIVAIQIQGIAALHTQPLAALAVAGFHPNPGGRNTISELTAALIASTKKRAAVILVDDCDQLDDASWGVINAVRSAHAVPVVVSRETDRTTRGTRVTEDPSAASSYVIELAPLAFEPIQRIVHDRLGGASDVATVARIFSKSGGNVGLALSIVEVALQEQRIIQGDDGRWVAVKSLWSPALRGIIDARLASLAPETLDTVHLLALVGVADVEAARLLCEWDTVEQLEDAALVQVTTEHGRQYVSITPPIIVDFIRNDPHTARNLRLVDIILERLGADHPLAVAATLGDRDALETMANNAVFSRLLQERARSHRLLAEARWNERPEAAEAVELVTFLMQCAAPHDTIQRVFEQTDLANATEQSLTQLRILRARWIAYSQGELTEALKLLEVPADASSAREAQYLAAAVMIRASISQVPDDLITRLESIHATASENQLAVLEARLYLAVIQGRFDDSEKLYQEIAVRDPDGRRHISRALYAYALTGNGRVREALELATAAMNDAHSRLDLDALRTSGSAAALAHIFVGNFDAVGRILDILLAAGDSFTLPRGYIVAVLNVASIVALRRGDVDLAEKYVNEISSMGHPDGPLPGQDACWSRAQLLAAKGKPAFAAEAIWASSEALWDRRAFFSASLGYISSLELDPNKKRFEHARARIETVDGEYIRAAEAYIGALVASDPERMHLAAHRLQASGRIAYAIEAFRNARRVFLAQGDVTKADKALHDERELLHSGWGQAYDSALIANATYSLSDRERQIARYVAEGFSNSEIASALVISARTVESHLYRVLRKLNLEHRSELQPFKHML